MKIFCLVLLAGLNTVFSQTATQPLQIPKANAPAIDGKLGEDEWKNALKQELVGGGELRLQHDENFLYIGVHGTSHGWCHVYVTAGDTIFVHHASAALGTATYLLKGELWQPQQTFVWELRERTFTPQAEAARAAYLKSKGWLANNMNTGTPGIIEFKIASRFLKGEVVRLAVAFASDPASPQYWPQTLADDCRKRELIFGTSPSDLKFNRESWEKLKLPVEDIAGAQNRPGANSCASPEADDFDFQIGVWRQVGGNQIHEIKKLLNGCVIQEVWKADGNEFAVALKSCDEGRHRDGQHRWMYSWVASGFHQLWEGRKEEGQWRFYREWVRDGQPMLSRTYWTPISANALERIVEQSHDGGRTWSPHVKERYLRKS